ncbi:MULTISPECIES: hypothetical protein [unclassified Isoptericola]|uniref:hypothetical protein n=1 Tax=unclassified Isoptericola TaxID=2623355 RepID=UPI00365F3063
MPVPEAIPIAHVPDYRTETIGRYDGGQFFASITYASPEGPSGGADRRDLQRLFVVLHRFDDDGHHTGSDIWAAGTARDEERLRGTPESPLARGEARLEELLATLPGALFGDIAVRPFEVFVDGVRFGLVLERHDDELDPDGPPDWAELYPDLLGFHAPWDGWPDT